MDDDEFDAFLERYEGQVLASGLIDRSTVRTWPRFTRALMNRARRHPARTTIPALASEAPTRERQATSDADARPMLRVEREQRDRERIRQEVKASFAKPAETEARHSEQAPWWRMSGR